MVLSQIKGGVFLKCSLAKRKPPPPQKIVPCNYLRTVLTETKSTRHCLLPEVKCHVQPCDKQAESCVATSLAPVVDFNSRCPQNWEHIITEAEDQGSAGLYSSDYSRPLEKMYSCRSHVLLHPIIKKGR
jgi:hypothetical protein